MTINEKIQSAIFGNVLSKGWMFKGDLTYKAVYRLVKKYIGKYVLDVGAGSGALVKFLRTKGMYAVGIDLNEVPGLVDRCSIINMRAPDRFYGSVFMCDVIEHLADGELGAGLNEIARVLKPDGTFIVVTPHNEDLTKNECICPHCSTKFHRWGHQRSFTTEGITELLSKYGFDIQRIIVLHLGFASLPIIGRLWRIVVKFDLPVFERSMIVIAKKLDSRS